mmetsp:Transcript_80148/g.226883  ORF Transcript_80148/g.226883 Transcript_80148/m.226883 type:complete len:557 (-) Transcript_80148:24-1694(-)
MATPGFWRPAPVPIPEPTWRKLDFRGRLRAWVDSFFVHPNPVPFVAAVAHIIKLLLWFAIFNWCVRDRKLILSAELNVKRWVLYNILVDVLGCGATSGPLGFKYDITKPFETWWYFLTPGTVTQPLVPALGGLRTKTTVALFVAYCMALLAALAAPAVGPWQVAPVLALLAALVPFDVLPFFASRGEHYVYQAVCFMFPGQQWRFGCQMVQVALWTGAGLSKVGPWFKHVVAFMVPNCVFLAPCVPAVRRALHRDAPKDLRPSAACALLAAGGTATELVMGWLCLFEPTRQWGVRLALVFHSYILSMTPIASVFEWNIYSMLMANHLFAGEEAAVWPPPALAPTLKWFLVVALLLVPLLGQLRPSWVPFLMAYRPYAGNWRAMWCVLADEAVPKLRRLRTFGSPLLGERGRPLLGAEPRFEEHLDYFCNALLMFFPNYRALPSIIEAVERRRGWAAGTARVLAQVPLENYITGWSLWIGWGVFRDIFRATVQEVCGFAVGECFFVFFEPMGLFGRVVRWRVVDVSSGEVVMSGQNAYSELEGLSDPLGFPSLAKQE